MYFYHSLVYGEPQLQNRTQIRSDYLDITNWLCSWLSQSLSADIWFLARDMRKIKNDSPLQYIVYAQI